MENVADAIIHASPKEIAELKELLGEHKLGVFALDGGGNPQCPQGFIWNGTSCVVDPG